MREIKFRVWDNKRNFMDYEPQITIDMGYINNIGVVDCNGDFRPYKYEIIMQYTGLKDKNGKEIYEGDILTDYVSYGTNEEGLEEMDFYVVEWDETNAKFICRLWDETVGDDFENCDISDLEVFGNIYEDKDRIKSDNK